MNPPIVDDESYIAIRKRRTQAQARKYCFEKYENSSLWSRIPSDCENFTRFIEVESTKQKRKRYWVGLCKNETDSNEMCNAAALGQLHNCNDSNDQCVSVKMIRGSLSHRLEECDDKKSFVCQGNEIFLWLIDGMQ